MSSGGWAEASLVGLWGHRERFELYFEKLLEGFRQRNHMSCFTFFKDHSLCEMTLGVRVGI